MISALESITLDGVMQSPGRPDEDTRGGFTHGGWAQGYADQVAGEFMTGGMGTVEAMLFGRRTYEDLLAHWSAAPEPNPFRDVLRNTLKYVVSSSPAADYPNTTIISFDDVASLRETTHLFSLGSGQLVRALDAAGLMDAWTLQIHPIVLGSGTRLFADGPRHDLVLETSVTTTTGVVIAQYSVKR